MENTQPSPEAISAVQGQLLLCAVRALMESHPNAASFRESWAHALSLIQREMLRPWLGDPDALSELNSAFAKLLPVWESYFPDSDAAKTKPA